MKDFLNAVNECKDIAKKLRDQFVLKRKEGSFYVKFLNKKVQHCRL